jgi:hypothetical protein
MNNVSVTSRRKKHAKRGKLQFQFLSPATSFFGLKLAHASSFAIFEAFPEIKAGIFGVDETLTIGVLMKRLGWTKQLEWLQLLIPATCAMLIRWKS